MDTQYIIKFIKDTFDVEVDGYVTLFKNHNIPIISVATHNNINHELYQTLLYKYITNSLQVTFDDNLMKCKIYYDEYKSTISFDDSSASAYAEFKKQFSELLNSKYETELYPSGNVMYIGEVLTDSDKRIMNGTGTLYYDTPYYKIKYTGEFENSLPDGAGIFYSMDNKIYLTANNISSGIPTQSGKLYIMKETIELEFDEVWEKFALNSSKDDKKEFILSDTFVMDIAELYWDNMDISLDELLFKDASTDEKYIKLWKELKEQQSLILEMNNNINQQVVYLVHLINNLMMYDISSQLILLCIFVLSFYSVFIL